MLNSIKVHEDSRGKLIPFELELLPFIPKRVFVVNNVPESYERGNHAHYKTKQFLICVNGTVDVHLNDGTQEETYRLHVGNTIIIPELVWDKQVFLEKNSEILVLCSTNYDIQDYIFDFEEFKKIKNT